MTLLPPHVRLRRWMVASGFSPRALGAVVGVSRSAVQWWMSGTTRPKVRSAMAIEQLGGPKLEEWLISSGES